LDSNFIPSREGEQTDSHPSSERQVTYTSRALRVLNHIPFAIPFDDRRKIFRSFVNDDMAASSHWSGGTRVSVRRGSISQDAFDKLNGVDMKPPIEITILDQFGQEE
jgi:ubiquitin-protein ligase E3 C